MEKSRFLAIVLIGLACLYLIACQTGGTPKKSEGNPITSDSTPTKSLTSADTQAPTPANSAGRKKTASPSVKKGSVASAQRKAPASKAVAGLGNRSSAVMSQPIKTMRAVIFAALAAIFIVVIAAIIADRVGRHRKLTPSPVNARH